MKIPFFISSLFFVCFAQAQNLEWVINNAGSGEAIAFDSGFDSEGNVYNVGTFEETADFDPNPETEYNITSGGGYDAYVLKLGGMASIGEKDGPSAPMLSAYPNPTKESITINCGSAHEQIDLNIYDLSGQFLYSQKGAANQNAELLVDLSGLNPGVYLVQVLSVTHNQTIRITKQ